MPNLSQVLKAEIARISRKVTKASAKPLRSAGFIVKRTVASLKKRVFTLESANKRLIALVNELHERNAEAKIAEVKDNKVRITSRTVKALRTKLGLSQDGFASLLGVSGQAVYVMEHKGSRLRLRTQTVVKFLSLRGIGKREAARRLEEIEAKSKKVKATGRKKQKGKRKRK
jgi:DNA-binding transcriptional regulator YiaG